MNKMQNLPSDRELNDFISETDLTVLKGDRRSSSLIKDSNPKSINSKTMNLQNSQNDLKKRLGYLLCFESIISGLYSGLSIVALKLLVDIISDKKTQDMPNDHVKLIGTLISSIIFVISTLYNFFTLNHILSLYPSLKAVPCYQSFIIICSLLCGGIILEEYRGYTIE